MLTPSLPNVLVRDISGRIQALFLRCSGCLIQSSQYLRKWEIYYQRCRYHEKGVCMGNKNILAIWATSVQVPAINRAWASNLNRERNLSYKANVAHVRRPSQLYHYHSTLTHTIESYHSLIGNKSPGNTRKNLERRPNHLYIRNKNYEHFNFNLISIFIFKYRTLLKMYLEDVSQFI